MDTSRKVIDITSVKVACASCSLRQLCLPMGISPEDVQRLDDIIKRKRPISRGGHIFRAGDTLSAIYAIRSGWVKSYAIAEDGSEQVTGFHLPGELIGLDAIASGEHPCSAKALDTTSICDIPFDRLEDLAAEVSGLQRQLLRIMSQELTTDEELLMLLGKRSAEERLAALLLSISSRLSQRGYSAHEFRLPMSRNDIGNYLGLAVETVSRLFTRFQQQGLLSVQNKLVSIQDLDGLKYAASASSNRAAPSASA